MWHFSFGQFLLNMGEIAPGSLKPQKNLGPIPNRNSEFSIQHLQDTLGLERDGLMAKADRPWKGKVTQNSSRRGLLGGTRRRGKTHHHKIESQEQGYCSEKKNQ
jgi:hypothetical protein